MFGKRNTPTHHRKASSGQFYFVTHNPGHSESVRDKDDDVDVIELKGSGSAEEEYRPKAVNRNLVKGMSLMKQQQAHNDTGGASKTTQNMNALSRVLFAVFGGRNQQSTTFNEEGAKKVDPKLFFANERTFLKWMNVSVWVAGISIGLSSIGGATPGGLESVSGLFFLAVAIVLVCYSMYQYAKRSLLVVKRSPGPYEDRWGPVVIGSLFVLAFTAQYCILMASMTHTQ